MSLIEMLDTPPKIVADTRAMLERYLAQFPQERAALQAMQAHLEEDGLSALVRSTMRGHVTTSTLVIDPDEDRILLIHHRVYSEWFPSGGHYEFPGSLVYSALRENLEETAVRAMLHPWCETKGIPLDIDIHPIPANDAKGEGEHFHYDVTYLATARVRDHVQAQVEEVHEARVGQAGNPSQ